ncbi:DUF6197 family protein [Streptomyces xiamenensis]
MSARTPAGLADDAEQWLAGLTAVGMNRSVDDRTQRRVGEWVVQVQSVPAADIVAMLTAARGLIAEHGWVQGLYGMPGVGFSVVGAVEEAAHMSNWDRIRRHRAERASVMCLQITLAMWDRNDSPSEWNDDLRTHLGSVISLMAAARLLAARIGGR